jgi:hypothetical protein
MRILCMAARQGPKVLFCTPDRTRHILFIPVMNCGGASKGWGGHGLCASPLQMHFNFLANLAADPGLAMYNFPLWDFHAFGNYTRWSINCFVFKGALVCAFRQWC